MKRDMLTISGERWIVPQYDGCLLAPPSKERATMRFYRVADGYARGRLVYRTFDPSVLARAFRYTSWRATGRYYTGGRAYNWTIKGTYDNEDILGDILQ